MIKSRYKLVWCGPFDGDRDSLSAAIAESAATLFRVMRALQLRSRIDSVKMRYLKAVNRE